MPCVHPNAAGLASGADQISACGPADHDSRPVRAFATFTADLHALADWRIAGGIDPGAMESTGIDWLALYAIREARGIGVFLVNARQIKLPPARKSDWTAGQWIQRLHLLGRLPASFRPDAAMALLRAYLRHRAELIAQRAPHLLHGQKALHQLNIQAVCPSCAAIVLVTLTHILLYAASGPCAPAIIAVVMAVVPVTSANFPLHGGCPHLRR